ncbi:hypothetical protein UlMin_022937 [Ulmus minor]
MAEVLESREWYMAAYAPRGIPTSDHLKLRTVTISLADDSIPDQHLVLENLFFSIDPYLRSRMNGIGDGLCFPSFKLNDVIRLVGIGRVIRSKDSNYADGDIVFCKFCPLAEFCVIPSQFFVRKIDPTGIISLPEYLSLLGVPGFAAWVGISVIGDPKPGSNVFISAAAGGVGMYAGQFAKIKGCRVIGSVGTDDKVNLVKEEFGYDDAFNYKKETDFDAALTKYFPDGIDLYLDNVGGKMLEAVLNHVNKFAKIPVCGMISEYNKVWNEREGVRNLLNMVGKEVTMQGYLMSTYNDRFEDFVKEMEFYSKEGKISSKHKFYHGIESFLDSLETMFTGSSIGKVIIQLKE